jgi:multisubunit Na+/H+ antiporter MnhB subunit
MFVKNMVRRNKKAMELEILGWWILAIVVLIVIIIGIIYLRKNGVSAIDFIKNLVRFR